MEKITVLSLLFCLFVSNAIGQKEITTEDGKKIIVMPDGSWKYSEKELEKNDGKLVNLVNDMDDIDPFEIPKESKFELSLPEREKYDLLQFHVQRLKSENTQLLITANNNLKLLNEELKIAEEGNDVVESSDIQSEIQRISDARKVYERKLKILAKAESNLTEIPNLSEKESSETLINIQKDLNTHFDLRMGQIENEEKQSAIQTMQDFYFEIEEETSKSISDCTILFDGMDEQLKKQRRETGQVHFFSYTHPKLKSYFKSKDFMDCKVSVMKLGGYNYINLFITVASKDAKKNYGSIERGTMMRLTLVDGEVVYVNSVTSDLGTLQPYTGNTTYKVSYQLNKDQMNQLESTELDKIGLIWSTGFEEYDIYEVDNLMHLVNCLKRGNS